jgi:hypothetical protein
MQINLDKELVLIGGREDLAAQLSALSPASNASHPREQVVVRYASGPGTVRSDGRGFNLQAALTNPDGTADGQVLLSWETYATAAQLGDTPASPSVKLDEQGPIAETPLLTRVQGQWQFADGSTLTGIGGGVSIVSSISGSPAVLAADAVALVITDGTGRFAGARGLVTINGSVPSSETSPIFGSPGATGTQSSVQTFRLVT